MRIGIKQKKPKFSIVTISFNQEKYLRQSINSVLNQSYKNFEYIIVDGGSKDNSRSIIETYRNDSRVKIIFQEKDKGPVDSLNVGFKNATGQILGYVNSDDFFLKDTLMNVNNIFDDNLDLIFGSVYEVDKDNIITRKLYSKNFSLLRFRLGQCFVCQQATFFKKKAFDRTKGFNLNNKLNWDLEIIADLVKSGAKYKKVDNYLGCFRIYPGTFTSITKKNFRKKNYKLMLEIFYGKKKYHFDFILKIYFYFIDRLNFKFLFNKLKIIKFKIYKTKISYDNKEAN